MVDIYSPAVLNRVVQDLKVTAPSLFLLDTFFPESQVSLDDKIHFDVITGKPRLAPFVAPYVEGQIVQRLGYETKSVSPAYIKDKRIFEATRAPRRLPGDPIGGAIDPADNRRRLLAQDSDDQIGMLNRRLEWMASSILRTGSVTITGEKYPTTVVNFGRDAALTVTLTGTDLWPDAGSDPIGDLEDFSGLIREKSGATAIDVVMAENVWKALRGKQAVKDLLDKSSGLDARTSLNLGPDGSRAGATFKGYLGEFRLWVYTETYVDAAGATQNFLPANYLIMANPVALEGVRQFGRIWDEEAGWQALDYYQKSWINPDPSVRFLLMQSAPLTVPYRINASLCAKVI